VVILVDLEGVAGGAGGDGSRFPQESTKSSALATKLAQLLPVRAGDAIALDGLSNGVEQILRANGFVRNSAEPAFIARTDTSTVIPRDMTSRRRDPRTAVGISVLWRRASCSGSPIAVPPCPSIIERLIV